MSNETLDKATELGREAGRVAGSWIIDGNTSKAKCENIIQGYEQGDPETMDMCPSPLSGEWAGDPTASDIWKALGMDIVTFDEMEGAANVLDAYDTGFAEGFWENVTQSAYAGADYDPCGVCGKFGHKTKDHN